MNGSGPWSPVRGTATLGEKIEGQFWRLAQEILALGLNVVLDFGLRTRAERDELRVVVRNLCVGVELHYLDAPPQELWRRIEARNSKPPWDDEPIGRADLDEWMTDFQAPDADELALYDPPPPGAPD
jgi:predicted kinase